MSMVGRHSLFLSCFAMARVCHHFSNHFSVPAIFDSFPGCYFVSTSTVVFLLLELHLLVFQITTTLQQQVLHAKLRQCVRHGWLLLLPPLQLLLGSSTRVEVAMFP